MPHHQDAVPGGRVHRTMPLAAFTARAAGGRLVGGLREKAFFRTIELLDIQAVWFKPAQIKRILAAHRPRGRTARPEPHPLAKPQPAMLAGPRERH